MPPGALVVTDSVTVAAVFADGRTAVVVMPAFVMAGIAVVVVVLTVTNWLAAAAPNDGAGCGPHSHGTLVTEPEPHATSVARTNNAPIIVNGARVGCGSNAALSV